LLNVGEKADSSEIIREVLNDEDVDDDYRLYELLSKCHDLSTGIVQLLSDIEKPNFITLASSELAPNMFEAGSCQIPLH